MIGSNSDGYHTFKESSAKFYAGDITARDYADVVIELILERTSTEDRAGLSADLVGILPEKEQRVALHAAFAESVERVVAARRARTHDALFEGVKSEAAGPGSVTAVPMLRPSDESVNAASVDANERPTWMGQHSSAPGSYAKKRGGVSTPKQTAKMISKSPPKSNVDSQPTPDPKLSSPCKSDSTSAPPPPTPSSKESPVEDTFSDWKNDLSKELVMRKQTNAS